jgi:hypothetical protein
MTNYTTLGSNLKRGIFKFCEKISDGRGRTALKFVTDMVYGLLASKSCHLTKIARKLNEGIALDKTVERLSRNLMNFKDGDLLWENYLQTIQVHFDDKTVLLFDDSDIAKESAKKLEGLCDIYDGSEGETSIGYWFAGVNALTAGNRQPIPVSSRVYSSAEEGYAGKNEETLKSLKFISEHFPKSNIRAFDRAYDGGFIFDYLIPKEENFIVRMKDRYVLHKGKPVLVKKLAKKYNGYFSLKFESKSGRKTTCKISMTPVSLPDYPDVALNLVVCRGFGKEPLILLTNVQSDDPRLCVTISKVYLMRWRIEEYYKFKKQGFGFEKFLVRKLVSIRNLDMLLSIAIGYIGTLSEKLDESVEVREIVEASKRLYGLSPFTFYALSDGLFEIFGKLYSGIKNFFKHPPRSNQLCFCDCFLKWGN